MKAGYASILVDPAAPAVIDQGNQMISEGNDKIQAGQDTIDKAWIADSIGKGHAYTEHANKQGRGEFKANGISGNGTIQDKEKFVSFITSIINDGKAEHKSLERGREAYWDDKTGTVVITDPNNKDNGTAFKPDKGKAYYDGLE